MDPGYDFFKLYFAIKLHFFSKSYDFFLNEGRFKSQTRYFDSPQRKRFNWIATKYKPRQFAEMCVANFVHTNKPLWIGSVSDTEAHENYLQWRSRIDSLSYRYQQDLKKVQEGKNTLYKLYRRKDIMPETPILMSMTGKVNLATFGNDEVPAEINPDPLKLIKYKTFLTNWNLVNIVAKVNNESK